MKRCLAAAHLRLWRLCWPWGTYNALTKREHKIWGGQIFWL